MLTVLQFLILITEECKKMKPVVDGAIAEFQRYIGE